MNKQTGMKVCKAGRLSDRCQEYALDSDGGGDFVLLSKVKRLQRDFGLGKELPWKPNEGRCREPLEAELN